MTFRRIAVAILVLAAILAGVAGFFLREPSASADSIVRIPTYQSEALLARARALDVPVLDESGLAQLLRGEKPVHEIRPVR